MNLNDNIIFFGTNNIEKIHQFYNGILGLSVYMEQSSCILYNLPGGGKLGFCSHINPAGKDPIITFVTDDVDEYYKLFMKNNIECAFEPKVNTTFNLYHFFAEDYDGHRIEIQKFL